MFTRTASARYDGLGKDGKGRVSTQSGVLADQPYGFGTRFGDEPGTNPEELIAAAHAACFTMALSFGLARAGHADGTLETTARVKLEKEGEGFKVSRSSPRSPKRPRRTARSRSCSTPRSRSSIDSPPAEGS